ncbi:hypothetical protein [Novosphingobium sp.]|uniref:hypothetical protein n=1 Tax=Novosphingobium sp. TaxID=1874826 RepID=UPI0025F7BB9A|nr:hypothetical protein [Novosphingobium sp.]
MIDDDGECGDPDGLAYDLEVARGMRSEGVSKRQAAERIWKAISAGKADPGTKLCWVEHIAKELCSEIIDKRDLDDKRRGSAALIAMGIYGKDDEFSGIRSLIEMWLDFGDIVNDEVGLKFHLTPKMIVQACQDNDLFRAANDRAAVERARRQLKIVLADRARR